MVAVVGVIGLVGLVGLIVAAHRSPTDPTITPTVGRSPSDTRPPLRLARGGDGPPPIVVRADGPQLEAWQGSYCWGNTCADMTGPPWRSIPVAGAAAALEVGFADLHATWVASLGGDRRCSHYPVRLRPLGAGAYEATAAGPPGEYRLDLFVRPAGGGDTSGAVRWTTPGASAPQSWAHLHQNTPSSGGEGVVQVVLDGAAVDQDVSGTVTVSGDGGRETFLLAAYDQGCPGDRYVTLAPPGPVDRQVDRLGDGPYTYDVDVLVHGTHHRATATSSAGAEDTPLVFEPALPG